MVGSTIVGYSPRQPELQRVESIDATYVIIIVTNGVWASGSSSKQAARSTATVVIFSSRLNAKPPCNNMSTLQILLGGQKESTPFPPTPGQLGYFLSNYDRVCMLLFNTRYLFFTGTQEFNTVTICIFTHNKDDRVENAGRYLVLVVRCLDASSTHEACRRRHISFLSGSCPQ